MSPDLAAGQAAGGYRADHGRDLSRHPRDHLNPGVASFQVGDCFGDFGERVRSLDLGAHLSSFNQFRKEFQILAGCVRRPQVAIAEHVKTRPPNLFASRPGNGDEHAGFTGQWRLESDNLIL